MSCGISGPVSSDSHHRLLDRGAVRQPTMEDVAARAGVSRALVSLVMRESPKVSDKSRAVVLAVAQELGYRPNLMARSLASRCTMILGVLLNDLHNPYFAEVTDGIQAAASEAGYRLVVNTGLRSNDGEREAVNTLLELRTDGIIMVGPWMSDESLVAVAREAPLVVVGRSLRTDAFDTVNTDDVLGARLVVDHLVALGHERIAHIDGGVGAGANNRRDGYVQAMRSHGLARNVRIIRGDYTEVSGTRGVERLLAEPELPTAIFTANDLMASGALDRLEDAGIDVPGDVSLVGFDNTALAALHHISLSTVNQQCAVLGRLASTCLVERLEQERTEVAHHVLAPMLVARATSGPCPR